VAIPRNIHQNQRMDRSANPVNGPVRAAPIDELTTEQLLGPLNEVERKNAPPRLFFIGDRTLLQTGRRVSIVGSRKASAQGLRDASELARSLVDAGVTVVSGLAEGIDTAAHSATIEAGGRTIAVLGTPLDRAYPQQNRALQVRIAREHLLISQFAIGSTVRPSHFPVRNRTMALLSDATVIVEAGEKSGSLHQGWEALRLGRPLFILESQLLDPSLSWPGEFARYGAKALSNDDLGTLLDFLPEKARGEVAELTY
jgi:DNA processing protein